MTTRSGRRGRPKIGRIGPSPSGRKASRTTRSTAHGGDLLPAERERYPALRRTRAGRGRGRAGSRSRRPGPRHAARGAGPHRLRARPSGRPVPAPAEDALEAARGTRREARATQAAGAADRLLAGHGDHRLDRDQLPLLRDLRPAAVVQALRRSEGRPARQPVHPAERSEHPRHGDRRAPRRTPRNRAPRTTPSATNSRKRARRRTPPARTANTAPTR